MSKLHNAVQSFCSLHRHHKLLRYLFLVVLVATGFYFLLRPISQNQSYSWQPFRETIALEIVISALLGAFLVSRASERFGAFTVRLIKHDTILRACVSLLAAIAILSLFVTTPLPAFVVVSSITSLVLIWRLITLPQAPRLIRLISDSLDRKISKLHDNVHIEGSTHLPFPPPSPQRIQRERRVHSLSGGYLHSVHYKELVLLAQEHDTVLTVHRKAGDYIVKGETLVTVSSDDALTPMVANKVRQAIRLSEDPESPYDILFPLRSLTSLTVNLFSRGIGDLPSAHMALHRLSSAIAQLAEQTFPSPFYYDFENRLRVISPPLQFPEIADTTFNTLRSMQPESPYLYAVLLEALQAIAINTKRYRDRETLMRQAILIERTSLSFALDDYERTAIIQRFQEVMRVLFPNRSVTMPEKHVVVLHH